MADSRFSEDLRYRQYDQLLAVGGVLLILSVLAAQVYWYGPGLSLRLFGLLVLVALSGVYFVYLLKLRQNNKVTRKNLKVKLRSLFQVREKIPLDRIDEVRVVNYPTFAQRYGRSGWLNGEKFLSLVGRNGVEIRTLDGDVYFVGTKQPEALAEQLRAA